MQRLKISPKLKVPFDDATFDILKSTNLFALLNIVAFNIGWANVKF